MMWGNDLRDFPSMQAADQAYAGERRADTVALASASSCNLRNSASMPSRMLCTLCSAVACATLSVAIFSSMLLEWERKLRVASASSLSASSFAPLEYSGLRAGQGAPRDLRLLRNDDVHGQNQICDVQHAGQARELLVCQKEQHVTGGVYRRDARLWHVYPSRPLGVLVTATGRACHRDAHGGSAYFTLMQCAAQYDRIDFFE